MVECKSVECLFCRIAGKKIPSKIVYEDETVVAFQDINPQAPVHLLIIPKKHVASIWEITSPDSKLVGNLILVAQKLARENKLENGFRLVANHGPDAGQSVDHLHFHLLGGRKFSWPPG